MKLLQLVKERTKKALNMTDVQLDAIINEDKSSLHDPFLYDGMETLIDLLHEFKLKQDQDPSLLLIIDTDYDTDGVMSAAVLSAALDVFNINYRVYVPSMNDGYGLNVNAVNEMKELFENEDYTISMILTADNGTNAIEGVAHANALGIDVLVTDHHLGGNQYADAKVIVNPNKIMPNGDAEPYPFKGNAGAAVAWKTAQAYAQKYKPEAIDLIDDLIVFAGIANVADVMPIIDENHYMVRKSVEELKRLTRIRLMYGDSPSAYDDIKSTPYTHYNSVFYGLYDLIKLLQEFKDEKRLSAGKKSIPLPDDEELISWYLSPMINAPRRIHASSRESMLALLAPHVSTRMDNIKAMISMNELKSKLRNDVLDSLDYSELYPKSGNVLFVNAQHGISGLVAGQVAEKTKSATIVFALPTQLPQRVYSYHEFDTRFDKDTLVIGASARSNPLQPLNIIVERIMKKNPDIVVGGGGHAAAAGYSIRYKYLEEFALEFDKVAAEVKAEMIAAQKAAVKTGEVTLVPENVVKLGFVDISETLDYVGYNVTNAPNLRDEMLEVLDFQQGLKPFGKDFNGQTTFVMDLNPLELTKPQYNLNLAFWKTFKFNINGVDVITFNTDLGDLVKDRIATKNDTIIPVTAELKINEYQGRITPQLILN